jgi:hypothetical protein
VLRVERFERCRTYAASERIPPARALTKENGRARPTDQAGLHAHGRRVAGSGGPRFLCLRKLTLGLPAVLDSESGRSDQARSRDAPEDYEVHWGWRTARLWLPSLFVRGSALAKRSRLPSTCPGSLRLKSARQLQRQPVALPRDQCLLRFIRRTLSWWAVEHSIGDLQEANEVRH